MSNVFRFSDYREFIKSVTNPRLPGKRTQVALAKAMGCQAAYLSQVLKGKAEITEDHALGFCHLLGLNSVETEYFLVLVRISRAGTPILKNHLEMRRKQVIDQNREIGNRIHSKVLENQEAIQYYSSSWIPAVVHLATRCPEFQTAKQIAKRFLLPESEVTYHLGVLLKFGFVRREGSKWIFQGSSIHIPKHSPEDLAFQTGRRLHALGSLARRRDDDVHYANLVSIDRKTAETIRAHVITLLEKTHRAAEMSPDNDLYSLCLDFFRA